MHEVTLDEAAAHLTDLLNAAVRGETVLIALDDQHTVQLVPVARPKKRRQFGSAKGLFELANDFDAPLEDMREYME